MKSCEDDCIYYLRCLKADSFFKRNSFLKDKKLHLCFAFKDVNEVVNE